MQVQLNSLPTSIRLGPYTIPILQTKEPGLLGSWGVDPQAGYCIRVNPDNQPPSMVASTVFHEVIHGISELHGRSLGEKDVRALEVGLLGFLRDNPEWVKALLKSLK